VERNNTSVAAGGFGPVTSPGLRRASHRHHTTPLISTGDAVSQGADEGEQPGVRTLGMARTRRVEHRYL